MKTYDVFISGDAFVPLDAEVRNQIGEYKLIRLTSRDELAPFLAKDPRVLLWEQVGEG